MIGYLTEGRRNGHLCCSMGQVAEKASDAYSRRLAALWHFSGQYF